MAKAERFHNLKTLLRRGFLTRTVRLKSKRFLLKQVSLQEIHRLSYYLPPCGNPKKERVFCKAALVALSLVMLDGVSLLPNRESTLPSLVKSLSRLPALILDQLVQEVSEINVAYQQACLQVSEFADTPESKWLWNLAKSVPLHSVSWSGWKGAENLGLNEAQQVWVVLRELLDQLDRDKDMVFQLKWTVAVHSEKAVKHLETLDRALEEFRESLCSSEGKSLGKRATADDLVDELHRSLDGEFDEHDLAVMETEESILQQYQQHEEQIRTARDGLFEGLVEVEEIREVMGPSAFPVRNRR